MTRIVGQCAHEENAVTSAAERYAEIMWKFESVEMLTFKKGRIQEPATCNL